MSRLVNMRIAAGAALALAALAANAQVATGSLWKVSEATSQNAILANVPVTPGDVTFSVNTPFNFTSNAGYTVQNFLDSSAAFNIVQNTPGTLASPLDANGFGTLMYFTGFVTVVTGQQFTVTHDDGLTLIIDGVTLGAPGPTAPTQTIFTYTGPSGNQPFQLVYGECCGAPAVLQVALPFTAAVPEPETYALLLGGLGLVGWMGRRRRA